MNDQLSKNNRLEAYVYLLRSLKTGGFYIGWTTNLTRRLETHNEGGSSYAKSRGPWELIGFETFSTPEEAQIREAVLKRNSRMQMFFKKRLLFTRTDKVDDPTTPFGPKARFAGKGVVG